jgi:hypothetical protein
MKTPSVWLRGITYIETSHTIRQCNAETLHAWCGHGRCVTQYLVRRRRDPAPRGLLLWRLIAWAKGRLTCKIRRYVDLGFATEFDSVLRSTGQLRLDRYLASRDSPGETKMKSSDLKSVGNFPGRASDSKSVVRDTNSQRLSHAPLLKKFRDTRLASQNSYRDNGDPRPLGVLRLLLETLIQRGQGIVELQTH